MPLLGYLIIIIIIIIITILFKRKVETICVDLFSLRVDYKIKLSIYADKIMQFQFLTSLIMRVISACYTKPTPKSFLIYVTSEVPMYQWYCQFKLAPFDKVSCSSTISMRNITAVILYKFTSTHIKVSARYSSFNYCLSIWVINPN